MAKLIKLKKLNLKENINNKYRKWMNDSEVQKFTEQKYKKHSLKDIKDFVKEKNNSKDEFLYGIFLKKNFEYLHIGNIKMGPINWVHRTADISYFIGEKKLWGKGFATVAIKEIISIAKKKRLKKLQAGAAKSNVGSNNVLIKNGFKVKNKKKFAIIYTKNI